MSRVTGATNVADSDWCGRNLRMFSGQRCARWALTATLSVHGEGIRPGDVCARVLRCRRRGGWRDRWGAAECPPSSCSAFRGVLRSGG